MKALRKSQKSLKDWGDQDWDYVNKKDKKKPVSQRGRYLPKSVRESLTASEKAATNRAKKKARKQGKQFAKYSKTVAKKVRNA
jgi:hypothetical protein